MIHDKLPEIKEDFTLAVKRGDSGETFITQYSDDRPKRQDALAQKIMSLAKEILKWTGRK